MKAARNLVVCVLAVMLTSGCATRVEIAELFPQHVAAEGYRVGEIVLDGVHVPDDFVRTLRAYLEDDLAAHGLLAGRSAMRTAARRVDIVIAEFAMPSRESRRLRGGDVGSDRIRTNILVHDSDGLVLATSSVRSSDPAISPEPDRFTSLHARAIGRLLSGRG